MFAGAGLQVAISDARTRRAVLEPLSRNHTAVFD